MEPRLKAFVVLDVRTLVQYNRLSTQELIRR